MTLRLEELSQANWVDYYRCDRCQHVWTVPREECEPVHDVTPRVE